MKAGNSEKNRIIINKLVNSGINVTPSILNFIINLENPIEKVNLIIKESSFIPSFNGHLTTDILKKISNSEIKKVLKRNLIKEDSSKLNKIELINSKIFNGKITNNNKENRIKDENVNLTENQLDIDNPSILTLNDSIKSENKFSIKIGEKKKKMIKLTGSAKSSFEYKPIAKEYKAEYKILKDPTGKLYTTGSYEDFYDLTLDKFNHLYALMRKRGDVLSTTKINNIFRNTLKQEISVIGLVNDIRKTKNGHYLINLEDQTGSINVLVNKNSENEENLKIAKRIIKDQMIFIDGIYNPGENRKKGIIFANLVSKIDIPRNFSPNRSPDPLSIALISDTHIGSREFEEKLWNKFINFLNGKIGNKSIREIAGRIKYIIINGDLVDGIGVYPNQKNDLIISDIFQQFKKAAELLSGIPEHIEVFYTSGNHEPVRKAIPRPAVPKKYVEDLINLGVKCLGNPTMIKTHNVNTLSYHGDSMIDLNLMIQGLENKTPVETMKELLICRHLAPIYGKKTQIAPISKDWLVIDKIPDIFHTGHVHINGMGHYHNVSLVNSGCFQSQTEFMNSFGIHPTPGIVSIIELDTLNGLELDLRKFN